MANNQFSLIRNGSTPANDPRTQVRWMGFEDARNGRGFCREYETTFKSADQRNYERGRQQAILITTLTGKLAPYWPRNMLFSTYLRDMIGWSVAQAVRQDMAATNLYWRAPVAA
jgi:hypothetical protein